MKSVNKELYASLKEDSILTTNPIGGKSKVFRMLENSGLFEDVLIPYVLVEKTDDVLLFLKRYNKILLKPVFSNQGRNIIVIEQLGDVYRLMDDNVATEYSYAELIDILNLKYLNPTYICQPFIESKTKEGSPFDIRLHVRKMKMVNGKRLKYILELEWGKILLLI